MADKFVYDTLARRGRFIEKAADGAEVARLIASLAPRETDHPLIRVGGNGDGGYLVPDDLDGIAACFSPGVSEVAKFELELAERGIPSHLADYSVEQPPESHPLMDFEKKFLGNRNDDIFMRIDEWVARKAPEGDLLLQMDIEGAEYEVLLDMDERLLARFRVVVIEFHWLDRMFHRTGHKLIAAAFAKLLRHFEVVHAHPNNCSQPVVVGGVAVPPLLEMTLLRRDRCGPTRPATTFPHPLDADNVPERRTVTLPRNWHA